MSRVRVNGGKIKFIRESKGLTQLYVATILGVTTDTVSRWENGRYPTVKWENVEGLAKALEVETAELLDAEEDSNDGHPAGEPAADIPKKKVGAGKGVFLVTAMTLIALFAAGLFFSQAKRETFHITATRFLPRHIAPGQPFPVVVRVESRDAQPFSFILEEKLPEDFSVVRSLLGVASAASGANTMKWISDCQQSPCFLAYLVQTPSDVRPAGKISFSGRIKANNAPGFERNVVGDSELALSNYHWVDANSDGVIDDAEILTAFSSADVLRKLGVDLEQIKRIWSAGGYRWDQGRKKYRIIQKKEVE